MSPLESFVRSAVKAFFEQKLVKAARQLLEGATGSFGLVLTSSIHAQRELVIAARAQTMSVAFYPKLGLLAWGSEASATKAALGTASAETADVLEGFRYDLDDVKGELIRITWDDEVPEKAESAHAEGSLVRSRGRIPSWGDVSGVELFRYGKHGVVRVAHYIEKPTGLRSPFLNRVVWFRNGEHSMKEEASLLTKKGTSSSSLDPVGQDIADIPYILRKIQDDWNDRSSVSRNRHTAFTFFELLRTRIQKYDSGTHDGSIDVLLTGCEVSLWAAEQFASDFLRVFPRLNIVCLSANKLLGQFGQTYPVPSTGFPFNQSSHPLINTICLFVSHSGGTFATVNACNVLKGFSRHLFAVTSDSDNQIARVVRETQGSSKTLGPSSGQHHSYVFTTFCGKRPAEAVSLTLAATHQVLTQLLLYTMFCASSFGKLSCTSYRLEFTSQQVMDLDGLNHHCLDVLETMIHGSPSTQARDSTTLPPLSRASSKDGAQILAKSKIRDELLGQGHQWSQHILEGPISWVMR